MMAFGVAFLCAAQEAPSPPPSPPPDNPVAGAFVTFAALVAVIPVVTEFLKEILSIKPGGGIWTQVLSWATGILLTLAGWFLDLGFLSGLSAWLALLYGAGASLAANGVFDTQIITAIFSLFKKNGH